MDKWIGECSKTVRPGALWEPTTETSAGENIVDGRKKKNASRKTLRTERIAYFTSAILLPHGVGSETYSVLYLIRPNVKLYSYNTITTDAKWKTRVRFSAKIAIPGSKLMSGLTSTKYIWRRDLARLIDSRKNGYRTREKTRSRCPRAVREMSGF